MFGVGGSELVILILIIALLIGPQQLPELFKSAGKWMKEIQKARDEFKRGIDSDDDLKSIKTSIEEVRTHVDEKVSKVKSEIQNLVTEVDETAAETMRPDQQATKKEKVS